MRKKDFSLKLYPEGYAHGNVSVIGLPGLIAKGEYYMTLMYIRDTQLYYISKNDFTQVFIQGPKFEVSPQPEETDYA
jgi:hypothetical protein